MKTSKRTRRAARRLYRACQVNGRLDPDRVRRAADLVAGSGRRGTVQILGDFLRLVRLDRDRHRAVIESAAGLSDDVRREVQAGLERTYGNGLETAFEVNPALIGGMRIRVGSDVYDRRVPATWAALEARL